MDTAQWPQQETVVKPMEERVVTNTCNTKAVERKPRPQKEQALNCPRCNSTNTKFCYYNNYSLTQPRYFCKTCRRYWTEGGSLRNIPVGGGSRKNRRSSSFSSSSSSNPSQCLKLSQIPSTIHDQAQDLNLGFPATQDFRAISQFLQAPNNNNIETSKAHIIPSSATDATTNASSHQHLSALELLTGFTSRGLNAFVPMPPMPADHTAAYSSGFPMQDFKPTLQFSLDGSIGNGYGSSLIQGDEESSRRSSFPFEDLKQHVSNAGDAERSRQPSAPDSTGYWTGMIGGGSW